MLLREEGRKGIIMNSQKKTTSATLKIILSRFLTTILFTVILLQSPSTAWAQEGNTAADMGLGIASFVATLPYGAVKLAYAGLGAIVGGFTYVLTAGNQDAAETVWDKSLLGTYVLTPSHLTGEKPIRFIGP